MTTAAPLRVLHVEDDEHDAALVERSLQRGGVPARLTRIAGRAALAAALDSGPWDLVLSDHALPGFSSAEVLKALADRDLPCIVVSGRIGEEAAVEAMRAGAVDYVGKDHLARLPGAVTRAVRERAERAARKTAEAALRVSQERYALAIAGSNDAVWDWDRVANRVFLSARWREMLGLPATDADVPPEEIFARVHPDDVERLHASVTLHLEGHVDALRAECRMRHSDGRWIWVLTRGIAVRDGAGLPTRLAGSMSDITSRKESMVDEVAAVLAETGLPPDRLHVEITESVLIEGTTRVATALARLRTMGVRVSLDDFGTGYSSLSYLHRFPIDTLKIDKSFVDRVAESPQFVGTIAALAGHLGMDVIAEGVETEDQARRLDALHCERGQGHLFGRPVEHPEGVPCASATTR